MVAAFFRRCPQESVRRAELPAASGLDRLIAAATALPGWAIDPESRRGEARAYSATTVGAGALRASCGSVRASQRQVNRTLNRQSTIPIRIPAKPSIA